jgi:GNAT superfamily N-acetyltransferase
MSDEMKLDNPVWYSLSETHRDFAIQYDSIKFYQPHYCPFGGFEKAGKYSNHIDEYSKLIDNFYIVGEKPTISKKLKFKKELVCLQMLLEERIDTIITETIIRLTEDHATELFKLVNEIQPGYFMEKTFLLGDYFGIFINGEMVAVTGERMKMDQCVEVSAIVTSHNYRGKGYARQLIAHTVNNIFNQNKKPFLHVAETNTDAIKLYESLGFKTRRKISFWNVVKSLEV